MMLNWWDKLRALLRGRIKRIAASLLIGVGSSYGTTSSPLAVSRSQPPLIADRVAAVRALLKNSPNSLSKSDQPLQSPQEIAQWLNWGNWANWSNWANWANWRNF